VTEPGGVLLDRVQLERAFTALGERLVRRGVVADVFVVGRAAMALAYDATRVTRDVDSLFVPHGVVLEEARNVARDLGLPRDIDDLRLLAGIIGVESAETALQICAEFFPGEEVPPSAAAVLRELFS
jgi:hypothetical protein